MPEAQGLQARGLRAYISSKSRASMLQVRNMHHFQHSKNLPNLTQAFALRIYITRSIHFDYGIFNSCFHDVYLLNAM